MNEPRARTFHVVTVVWGRPYVDLFLNVAVPNQMTPGNLGALPAGSRYRVFTSPEDADRLKGSAVLDRVRAQMPVDLMVMPELSDSSTEALARMTAGHCVALAEARDERAALVFLNADHFMSEGALAAVLRRHAAGSRAVASVGVRLNKDTFVAGLEARGGLRSVAPRDLVSMAMSNLHPFALAHMIDGASTALWPINIYWRVPREGILARAFYLHPLMVDPVVREALPKDRFTIDLKYLVGACPRVEQIHVVTDSDELCLFELSHVDAAVTEIAPGGIPVWRVASILNRCDPHQQSYWAQPIRLHAREIDREWDVVELQSARFAERAWRLRIVASWLRTISRRVNRYRRRVGELRKRIRRAARPLSPQRVGRAIMTAARQTPKRGARSARAGRRMLRRGQRSVALFAHSITRPLLKIRKRAVRVSRRVLRRARLAH